MVAVVSVAGVVFIVDVAAVVNVFVFSICRYVSSELLLIILSLIALRITDAVLLDVGWHFAIADGSSVELLLLLQFVFMLFLA